MGASERQSDACSRVDGSRELDDRSSSPQCLMRNCTPILLDRGNAGIGIGSRAISSLPSSHKYTEHAVREWINLSQDMYTVWISRALTSRSKAPYDPCTHAD
jgi:hypothetical protein